MNKLAKIFKTTCLLLAGFSASAQEAEMADTMRSNGKIYVVVAIVLVILIGLIVYLVFLDRKVAALEKRLSKKQ
jgi:CcmD family protein